MKDADKTKKQLLDELKNLRERVHELEELEVRRKFSETALGKSGDPYRSIVDASPVSIMAIRNGRILFSNPSGYRMLGFSDPQEMVGISALEVVAPESQPELAERIRRLETRVYR